MHQDVLELRNFYYRSALGRAAQSVVRGHLQTLWPENETKGQMVVGFGFAVPLLRPYLPHARRVIGLMPGPQGVMPWPAGQLNVAVLCEETLWPLDTGKVDKLVMMHGLDNAEDPTALLDEAYRVMGPGGRLVVVVPNRAGLWSRRDVTPFGHGRPYSLGQLEAQLKTSGFITDRSLSTLYQPPSHRRLWRKTANIWEKVGQNLPYFVAGGVLMIEARKQIPAPTRMGLGDRVKRPLRVLEGIGAKPEPARQKPKFLMSETLCTSDPI